MRHSKTFYKKLSDLQDEFCPYIFAYKTEQKIVQFSIIRTTGQCDFISLTIYNNVHEDTALYPCFETSIEAFDERLCRIVKVHLFFLEFWSFEL